MKTERQKLLDYMEKLKPSMIWDWKMIRSWEQSMKKIYNKPGDPDPLLALCELMADNIPDCWAIHSKEEFITFMTVNPR